MNELQQETSPYLLQHASNPVDWMPWSEQAFLKAAEENKPVLVSIGYSSCHWCHVMAHESFEDAETAALMNEMFVNIKVDREEFPDVDHMYMDAVQAMTGSGGWPLNVFVTPEKNPFYGGTYFPPHRTQGRASWKEVLINVSNYYKQNRDDVEQQASKLVDHLRSVSYIKNSLGSVEVESDIKGVEISRQIAQQLLSQADREEGGFGSAPKFPSTASIKYLLDHFALTGDEESLQHALRSLDKMMMGGIYDHLGGGFSRYSTDRYWVAPHFEKMLYDNALLIEVYAIAYSITKNKSYQRVVDEIIAWLQREMMSDEFGFYSAQDADSEGVEGKYYTWTSSELKTLLQDDYDWFAEYYQIKPEGNWEHTNILFTTYAAISDLSELHRNALPELHQRLFEHRSKRIKPLTDDKQLLGWNALMNKALVVAYLHLGTDAYLQLAIKNMQFLQSHFKNETSLYYHTYKNGHAKIAAYADDLAYLSDALITLSTAMADTVYLKEAVRVLEFLEQHFSIEGSPLFVFTNQTSQQVSIQKTEIYDGALPSPNAVLCRVFREASYQYFNQAWKNRYESMLQIMFALFTKYPASFANFCIEFQKKSNQFIEVCVVGEDAKKMYQNLYTKMYKPNVMYMTTHKEETIDCFKGKYRIGENLIYICRNRICLEPLRDVNEAFTEIQKRGV